MDHGAPTPPPEWDLLLSASQKNNPERIRALIIQEGVSPSHANRVGQSALHIAALWGHGELSGLDSVRYGATERREDRASYALI
jgi:hypothetical protein